MIKAIQRWHERFMMNRASEVNEVAMILQLVFDEGYYDPTSEHDSESYMCYAIQAAEAESIITEDESELARKHVMYFINEMKEKYLAESHRGYIYTYRRLINKVWYENSLRDSAPWEPVAALTFADWHNRKKTFANYVSSIH